MARTRKHLTSDTFPARLRSARLRAGLSKCRLARLAGVDRSQLRRFENGERMPTWPTLCLLADALGVSTEELR